MFLEIIASAREITQKKSHTREIWEVASGGVAKRPQKTVSVRGAAAPTVEKVELWKNLAKCHDLKKIGLFQI